MTEALNNFKIVVMGPPGTGKTHSIRTLCDAGQEVFALFTEPGFQHILGDIPPEKLHWNYIPASGGGWAALRDKAKRVNSMSYEALCNLSAINRQNYGQFLDILDVINDFKCERTGQTYGDVSTWGPDKTFVIDGLSGINIMLKKLHIGGRPTLAQGEWGVVMDTLNDFIIELTMNISCNLALMGHVEREQDEVNGGQRIMVSTLGKKLAPVLLRYFDEIVYSWREGEKFYWSNNRSNIDLKKRQFPFSDKLEPSFAPLVKLSAPAKSGY